MSMNPKNEKHRSDKYKRQGAKYMCNGCKKTYFSKPEVEACFDKHGGSEEKAS